MATTIDCLVDTTPMAKSINSVSDRVNGTTKAVVGMQSAVILAEKKAADNVCANVNRGFYTLIRSQISQKMAALHSEVDSQLMQLNQQRKQLTAIRQRMERDYKMIVQRYHKLFTSINKNLHQRVAELDRAAMNFTNRDMEALSNRMTQLTATVPVSQLESISQSQQIAASNLKFRSLTVIDHLTNFLRHNRETDNVMGRVLLPQMSMQGSERIYYPVIVSEETIDSAGNKTRQVIVSDGCRDEAARRMIRNTPGIIPDNGETVDLSDPNLVSAFSQIVQDSKCSERVKKLAMKLFMDSSKPQK